MKKINYDKEKFNKYMEDLQLVGMISSLFSDSNTPILYYRATENLYCSNLNADNLARSDVPADAKYGNIGVGIKTFVEGNKRTYQKIEEFNSQYTLYDRLNPYDKIIKIAELRNNRLLFTMNTYGIDELIFHCIIRNKNGFNFFEEPMDFIDVENIEITSITDSTIYFTDRINNYKFSNSKSTLYKQFITNDYFASIEVRIAEEPLSLITRPDFESLISVSENETLILPLYTYEHNERVVQEHSGLNQWNGYRTDKHGRKISRNPNEVYIPFPARIRKEHLDFFPPQDQNFDVLLPSGNTISMKICQQNGKALMSNPNKTLGEWILREVLQLEELELLTYTKLQAIGIDSVEFEKINDQEYKINFKQIDEIEEKNQ